MSDEAMERALLQHMDEDDAMTALQVLHPWLSEVERLREALNAMTLLAKGNGASPTAIAQIMGVVSDERREP